MIVKYKDGKDPRITKKRKFLREYLIILAVMLTCCSGAVLMFNTMITLKLSPWEMVICIGSYVLFMCLLVSLATRYIIHNGFNKPISQIGQAARHVAQGDFTVKIRSKRKDGKKDEVEVLIDDFNKMVEELDTIEMLKVDFISNISHEIKTPLAIIQSYATALKKENLDYEVKMEYIKTITEASKKLSNLVSNILRLNKLDSQEIVKVESFSLDEQIRCSILALESKFEEKNIELEIELDDFKINSDESLLEIVWNNILTNAIKFSNPGGIVKVVLKKIDSKAIVTIEDSGIGMDEETTKKIFNRFYQGDVSHSIEGNGLGLSLVNRILELLDGKISVESEKGKGTKLEVTLYKNKK